MPEILTSQDKKRILEEFTNRPFIITNTTKDTKLTNACLTYPTTRSAFIFPISGEAMITFDNETVLAKPGLVIHGCSNKKLSFHVISEEPFSHINIYYDAFEKPNYPTNFMNSIFYLSLDNPDDIISSLSQLYELNIQSDLRFKLKQTTIIHSIIERLFQTHPQKTHGKELIEDAIQYIQQHYHEQITLQLLADEFQMTPQQFSHLFYKMTGIRPIDYVIEYRLERATWLLKNNTSIKETAISVGYTDPFYFSRLFKRHFGISPSQFKKGDLCKELFHKD